MRNANNPRHRLTSNQVDEARKLYEDDGWKFKWISMHFHVHHSAIIFHAKFQGWIRRVSICKRMPQEIADQYRKKRMERNRKKMITSYVYIQQMAQQKRIENCTHVRWIRRCSLCGEILGSDATRNH